MIHNSVKSKIPEKIKSCTMEWLPCSSYEIKLVSWRLQLQALEKISSLELRAFAFNF
jgi:hypothetical protein